MTMIVGLDLGNRYAKLSTKYTDNNLEVITYLDEFLVSWMAVSEEDYNTQELKDTVTKVKYQGNHYFVGECGDTSITNRNKGDIAVIGNSKMVKLAILARCMISQGKTKETFQVVTGTPYDYHNAHAADYEKLMICVDEEIEINAVKCTITVTDCMVTKQGACVIMTLPARKTTNYLIWDFGGETLDVSYFEGGMRIKGMSNPFSLNRIYVELGHKLQKYIEVEHPDISNGRYQKSIERLLLEGHYYNIRNIVKDSKKVLLEDYCHDWLTPKVNQVISQVINSLDINRTILGNITHCFVGGGSKIIEWELKENKTIDDENKVYFDEPQYANVKAYYYLGNMKKWK